MTSSGTCRAPTAPPRSPRNFGRGESRDCLFVECSVGRCVAHRCFRGGVIALRTHTRRTSSETLRQHAPDFGLGFGLRRRKQALLHHLGRAHQQLAEQVSGNVRPRADLLGQHAVMLGALDQLRKAGLGKSGAGIVGDVAHHLAVAAPHQHVGDSRLRSLAAGQSRADAPGPWSWRCRPDRISSSRGDCASTGPATAMSSSLASRRIDSIGAFVDRSEPAATARRAPWFRSRRSAGTKTSSNRRIWSSLKLSAPSRNSLVMRCSMSPRFSRAVWSTSSSSGISEADGRHQAGNTQTRVNTAAFREVRGGIVKEALAIKAAALPCMTLINRYIPPVC